MCLSLHGLNISATFLMDYSFGKNILSMDIKLSDTDSPFNLLHLLII